MYIYYRGIRAAFTLIYVQQKLYHFLTNITGNSTNITGNS